MNRVHVNQIDIDDYIYFLNGKPFTGVMYETYPDRRISTEQTLRMGMPDGPMRRWLRNGTLASEKSYKMGLLHGTNRLWSANKRLRCETRYDLGVAVERKKWDWTGKLVEEFRIDPAGSEYQNLELRRKSEATRTEELEAELSAARFTPDDEQPE
jgi:antitoxin component YwqK of YwqJK toxin-antitoxin module